MNQAQRLIRHMSLRQSSSSQVLSGAANAMTWFQNVRILWQWGHVNIVYNIPPPPKQKQQQKVTRYQVREFKGRLPGLHKGNFLERPVIFPLKTLGNVLILSGFNYPNGDSKNETKLQ